MKESIALFLLVSTQIIASAKAAEVRIPYKVRSTAFCEAMLRGMEVHGLEADPEESHADIARGLLEAFKRELGVYRSNPDRRLANLLMSSEGSRVEDKSRVAARIDGILSDDGALHKEFLVLSDQTRIENFFAEVLQRESEVAALLRKRSATHFIDNMVFEAGAVAAAIAVMNSFKDWPVNLIFAVGFIRYFTHRAEGWRLSRRFDSHLMQSLDDFRSGWSYASASLNVNPKFLCPASLGGNLEQVARSYADDHRNYFDCFVSAFFGDTLKRLAGNRNYVSLDQFYFWDESEHTHRLVIVFRYYDEKPKNPKSQSQKQSEKGPLWSPLPSPSG